jgi:hypothetical protein
MGISNFNDKPFELWERRSVWGEVVFGLGRSGVRFEEKKRSVWGEEAFGLRRSKCAKLIIYQLVVHQRLF